MEGETEFGTVFPIHVATSFQAPSSVHYNFNPKEFPGMLRSYGIVNNDNPPNHVAYLFCISHVYSVMRNVVDLNPEGAKLEIKLIKC